MDEHNNNDSVIQVRYRTMQSKIALFYAKDFEPKNQFFDFLLCKVLRSISIENTGLSRVYAEKIPDVGIPNVLNPSLLYVEEPNWWNITRQDAEKELRELEQSPLAKEIGKKLLPTRENMARLLTALSPIDSARLQSKILSGEDIDPKLESQFNTP